MTPLLYQKASTPGRPWLLSFFSMLADSGSLLRSRLNMQLCAQAGPRSSVGSRGDGDRGLAERAQCFADGPAVWDDVLGRRLPQANPYRPGAGRQRAEQVLVAPGVTHRQDKVRRLAPEPLEGGSAFGNAGVLDLEDLVALDDLHVDVARIVCQVVQQLLGPQGGLFRIGTPVVPGQRKLLLLEQGPRQTIHVELENGPDLFLP